jgi:hypothetical protein
MAQTEICKKEIDEEGYGIELYGNDYDVSGVVCFNNSYFIFNPPVETLNNDCLGLKCITPLPWANCQVGVFLNKSNLSIESQPVRAFISPHDIDVKNTSP